VVERGGLKGWGERGGGGVFFFFFFFFFGGGGGRGGGVGREAARRGQSEPAPTSVYHAAWMVSYAASFLIQVAQVAIIPKMFLPFEQKNQQLQERTHTLPFETEYYGTLSTIN